MAKKHKHHTKAQACTKAQKKYAKDLKHRASSKKLSKDLLRIAKKCTPAKNKTAGPKVHVTPRQRHVQQICARHPKDRRCRG